MKNQKGFSLVETMIAVGLTAGLGYVLMQQNEMSNKQNIKNEFNQLVNTQSSFIQKELNKSENCTASFKNLAVGTQASPTNITAIRAGTPDYTTVPPGVTPGAELFKVKKNNSSGIYIDSMQLLNRSSDGKDVLRVTFVSGNVVNNVAKERSAAYGASRIPRDFIISNRKVGGVIDTCYSESTNLLVTSCYGMPGGEWNSTTKKCDIKGLVKRSDLINLWWTKDGTLALTKPADAVNGSVTCQKSSRRCSRTNLDCSLPACPANHRIGRVWEWDRQQSTWDKACMKSGECIFMSTPAGWMVKP